MSKSIVVVVTGVSSGIGRVTAEKFAKRGCQVFGSVRSIAKTKPLPVEFRRNLTHLEQ
jgi:NAD(P)-dependent dehydrogenase (short-subunit alcohol dehydrogenase family)